MFGDAFALSLFDPLLCVLSPCFFPSLQLRNFSARILDLAFRSSGSDRLILAR